MINNATCIKPKLIRTPIGSFPSVSAILSETSDRTAIDKWIKEVGWLHAESVRRAAIERGKELDRCIEKYIETGEISKSEYFLQAFTVLSEFDRCQPQKLVWHPEGYAGRFDCLATDTGDRAVLIEWKTAEKTKPDAWTLDARLQAVAYLKAAEYTLSMSIAEARVVYCIAGRTVPSVRLITGTEIDKLWGEFCSRLENYQQMYEVEF
jgi:hypothetical protein